MSCELSIDQLAEIAIDVVRVGMAIALDPPCDLAVDTKSNRNDLVTAVDRAIEEEIAARLEEATGLPLLGEEGHAVDSFAGRVWVLDPIDGTMNYVETHRDYAVSLALCEDGEPVLGVVADVVGGHVCHAIRGRGAWLDGVPLPRAQDASSYRAAIVITDIKEILALPRLARALQESRGHRRYGSAALECVEVARGRAGAFVHMWVSPWDIAAATLIATECGALATRLDGTPLDVRYKGSILLATPGVHASLVERLMTSVQEG